MSRENLIERLLILPKAIAETERRLLDAETARTNFQAHLTTVEDQLLLTGAIDGKNERERAAQLRAGTVASRGQVEDAAVTCDRLRLILRQQQNEFAAARAITRLLATE